MAEVASAYVSLLPSAKGFGSKLDGEISGDLKSSGKKAGATFGKLFAAGAGVLAGAGLGRLFSDSIGEAREAQKVGALTESIIKSTGGAAKITAAQVGDLSAAISKKSGIDDEAIQSGANLLLTFKQVRNEVGKGNDIFNRATQAAADLSAAGFGDLNGQAKMLGKALNDPIKGMTALSRSGVTFTQTQQDQVKALVESGNALKAQKIILGEVESQVGGAAEATATAGDKAAVAMGNLKEQAGTALLPVVDRLASSFTKDVVPAISGFISGMQEGTGAGGRFVDILTGVVGAAKSAGGFIKENKTAVAAFGITVAAVTLLVQAHGLALSVAAAGGLAKYLASTKLITTATKTWAAIQWVLNGALTANPIGLVVAGLVALGAGLVIAYKKSDTFRSVVDKAFSGVKKAADVMGAGIKVVMSAMEKGFEAVGKAGTWLWNNALQPAFKFIVSGIASILNLWASMLSTLAKVPGFGWAKTAADAMANAATKAEAMAAGIKKIPPSKTVNITVAYKYTGLRSPTRGRDDDMLPDPLGRGKASDGPQRAFNSVLASYGETGKNMMERIEKGIKSAKPRAVAAAQDAFDSLKSKMESKRDEIKSVADSLKDVFNGIRDSVAGAFTGGLFDVTATEGGASVGQNFITGLMGKKAELTGLLASFNTLKGWGVSPAFLTQLFSSGNGALITELAGMGQEGALATSSLFGDVTNLSTELGTAVASNDAVAVEMQTANATLLRMEQALAYLGGDIGQQLNQASAQAQRDKKNRGGKGRGKK